MANVDDDAQIEAEIESLSEEMSIAVANGLSTDAQLINLKQ